MCMLFACTYGTCSFPVHACVVHVLWQLLEGAMFAVRFCSPTALAGPRLVTYARFHHGRLHVELTFMLLVLHNSRVGPQHCFLTCGCIKHSGSGCHLPQQNSTPQNTTPPQAQPCPTLLACLLGGLVKPRFASAFWPQMI